MNENKCHARLILTGKDLGIMEVAKHETKDRRNEGETEHRAAC